VTRSQLARTEPGELKCLQSTLRENQYSYLGSSICDPFHRYRGRISVSAKASDNGIRSLLQFTSRDVEIDSKEPSHSRGVTICSHPQDDAYIDQLQVSTCCRSRSAIDYFESFGLSHHGDGKADILFCTLAPSGETYHILIPLCKKISKMRSERGRGSLIANDKEEGKRS